MRESRRSGTGDPRSGLGRQGRDLPTSSASPPPLSTFRQVSSFALRALRGSLRDRRTGSADDLAVAIEGRLTLEDLELRSSGDSFEAHLLSATASGRTSAQLRTVVTRGSLSMASFATGIGSLFSTEMGFASAVIEHFVGKWIATRGQLDIGSGALTLREHTLESPGATAYVTSRIDLSTGRLDTAIQLDRGPDGRIEYNMSLSGPLRSPTLRAEPNPGR